jgi:prepilin-type N-terminal cleavage/methylation domain-containing protein
MKSTNALLQEEDDGFSLIEVIVSVVILGITVTALLSALLTLVTSASRHREQSSANSILASAAESISDPSRNLYQPSCTAPSPSYLPADGVTAPAGWTIGSSVTAWNGAPTCVPNNALQTVTITVTATSGNTYKLEVLKRP